MQKLKKRINIAVVAIMVMSMLSMYAYVPAQAASLTDAKDTISNSDTGATNVTHTITASTSAAFNVDDYLEATFPVGITGIDTGNVTCSDGMTALAVGQVVTCTDETGAAPAGLKTMTITGTNNPAGPGSLTINLVTKDTNDVEIEKAQVKVYIIDNVAVSATVDASLTFSIGGMNVGENVNGAVITATSTATTTPFGTLVPNATSTVGQRINVGTNASDGYTVTVQQNNELRTPSGSNINSFKNAIAGAGLATPESWSNPTNSLADPNTWGHMGLTTSDDTTNGGAIADFTGGKFAGLAGAAPMIIMSHNGSSDGSTENVGSSTVAYSARITALQEAGDYTSILTYICTPQF